MKPFAPIIKYKGGRGEVERLLRLAVSPVVESATPAKGPVIELRREPSWRICSVRR